MMLAESNLEWIIGTAFGCLALVTAGYIRLTNQLRASRREGEEYRRQSEFANAQAKLKLDDLQREFWLKHTDAIRTQVRGELSSELANLNNRINALTDAHLKCETERIQVAADLRAALNRISELEKKTLVQAVST